MLSSPDGLRPGLAADPLPHAWFFDAIGVPWRIDTREPLPESIRSAVRDRIERFDHDWSRFRSDSLVSRMASAPGRYRLPDDAGPLLDWYRELYQASGGRVSPLVGGALSSLGYDAAYSLIPSPERVRVPAWADAIAWDGTFLEVISPVLLDVGAAGKGYLIDLVGGVLDDHGIRTRIIDASGDLAATGDVSIRVALEHPADPTKAIGVVELASGALAASATNRRAWGDGLHHVLDAVTGEPTRDVVATWVLADDALTADGAASALFFGLTPDWVHRQGIEYVRMFANGRVDRSAVFRGELL